MKIHYVYEMTRSSMSDNLNRVSEWTYITLLECFTLNCPKYLFILFLLLKCNASLFI